MWRRRAGVLGAAAVGVSAAVAVLLNLVVLVGGRCDDRTDAPVALVLGAGLRPDGTPSLMLADRLAVAADLYRTGRVRTVLASGDHGTVGYDEVGAMRTRLVELGVPDERVFTDHAGFDTWSSVVRAREVFRAERVLVVTQRFHLSRAVWLARRAGLSADGVAADLHPYGRLGTKAEVRETAARVKSVLEVVVGRRPRHLGPPFDLAGDGRTTKG